MEQQAEAMTFEQALARLEQIAAELDRNELPLADALNLCVEAATLRRFCHARLEEAEGKLQQLEESTSGEIRLVSREED